MPQEGEVVMERPKACQPATGSVPYALIVGSLLAVGLLLRFYHLADRSLWYDEAVTANLARGTWAQMVWLTRGVSAPILHPVLLYLTERVGSNAWIVRLPSALAGFAAVLAMFFAPSRREGAWAGLFAGAILCLSASQIRYSQEVREYSLAVLFATFLIGCLFHWEEKQSARRFAALCGSVFLAPFVQYGLVLLAAAVILTMFLEAFLVRDLRARLSTISIVALCSLTGDVLSWLLTLRFQLRVNGVGSQGYLAANYFNSRSEGLLHFIGSRTWALVSFFVPGQFLVAVAAVAGLIVVTDQLRRRVVSTPLLLLISSFAIVIAASVKHLYPYGGIRQCLFLAPVLIFFAGWVCAEALNYFPLRHSAFIALGVLGLICISGWRGITRQWPYGEFEDNQALLRGIARFSAPRDQVWVQHDAVDAFEFYLPGGDRRFTYGKYHADLNAYVPDLLGAVRPSTDRVWLAFSHLEQPRDRAEEQMILKTLGANWRVQEELSAPNVELYEAMRIQSQSPSNPPGDPVSGHVRR